MKKSIFFAALMMIIVTLPTFAQKSWPYVQWSSDPKLSLEEAVAVLKKAMQGQSIDGARVHANRSSYEAVWGTALYERILNADPSEFYFSTAEGDEPNYGVLNGKAQRADYIARGQKVLTFHGQVICKIGSNSCMNPTPFVLDEEPPNDPDLAKVPYKKVTTSAGDAKAEAVARLEITDSRTGKGGGGVPSFNELETFMNGGRYTMDVYERGVRTGQSTVCCTGQGGGGNTVVPFTQQAVYSQPAQTVQYVQTERYPTFGGAVLRETLGTAAGIGLAWGVGQLFAPRGMGWQQPLPNAGWGNNWGNNFVPQNPQPGFSGSSTPLGGSTWTGNNNTWNGGTITGGWSNTWQ